MMSLDDIIELHRENNNELVNINQKRHSIDIYELSFDCVTNEVLSSGLKYCELIKKITASKKCFQNLDDKGLIRMTIQTWSDLKSLFTNYKEADVECLVDFFNDADSKVQARISDYYNNPEESMIKSENSRIVNFYLDTLTSLFKNFKVVSNKYTIRNETGMNGLIQKIDIIGDPERDPDNKILYFNNEKLAVVDEDGRVKFCDNSRIYSTNPENDSVLNEALKKYNVHIDTFSMGSNLEDLHRIITGITSFNIRSVNPFYVINRMYLASLKKNN